MYDGARVTSSDPLASRQTPAPDAARDDPGDGRRLTIAPADVLTAAGIGVAVAVFALALFHRLDPRLLAWPDGNDIWFEGDLPTVFRNMVNRFSDQTRNGDHPLFPLLATIPVDVLSHLGLSGTAAVAAVLTGVAFVWGALLYSTLRLVRLRRLDAILFSAAGACSAAAIFWLPVPEVAGMASISMLAALLGAALADRGRLAPLAELAVSALTLSVTVTHWMAGLLLAFGRHPARRALQLSINAFALVVLLWSLQRLVVPTADFFIGYVSHGKFILRPESGGPLHVMATLVVQSGVMPQPAVRHEPKWGEVMTVQHAAVTGGDPLTLAARAAWIGMLALGAFGIRRATRMVRFVTLGTLAGQLALYAVFGEETFLYTLSTLPLLLMIAAHGTHTRARPVALLLTALFIVTAAWTNLSRFEDARGFIERRQPQPLAATIPIHPS